MDLQFPNRSLAMCQTRADRIPVCAGVPQGTKLGPILFVIMKNDLKLASPRCSYWKYVDDITMSESALARGVSILQSELDNISTWAATNNMVLNTEKCKEMTLRFRRDVDHLPSALAIDAKALESVVAHKVLGVTIQNNLKWDSHINEVVAKASKRLHILRVLKRGGVPPADLLKVYFALIRSVLEYCCPVWHNTLPVKLSDSIERVQKRALRIIYPALRIIYPALRIIYPVLCIIYPVLCIIYPALRIIYPVLRIIYPALRIIYPALRIIYPVPHYQEALFTTGCVYHSTQEERSCVANYSQR